MKKGELLVGEAALCALYLRGSPYRTLCDRRSWPLVTDVLLRHRPCLEEIGDVLRAHGRYAEAYCLTRAALDWGLDIVGRRAAFTFFDPRYPRGWIAALGSGAPPCAWIRGSLPSSSIVAIAGTRDLRARDRRLVSQCVACLLRGGWGIVSGGAVGTDAFCVERAEGLGGGDRCIEILPFGLDRAGAVRAACRVSVCEPDADFTVGQAMERNSLIYSFGRRAVVVRPRLKAGGTWTGAVDALRRRLAVVGVLESPADKASRALCSLGARSLSGIGDLRAFLEFPPDGVEPGLFGSAPVRESRVRYGGNGSQRVG